MELEHSVHVKAPPEAVWGRLMDPNRAVAIVPGLEKVELLDGAVYPGARVRVTGTVMGSQRHADGRIIEALLNRRLTIEAEIPEVRAHVTMRWDIEPDGDESTVTQLVEVRFSSMLARMAGQAMLRDPRASQAAKDGLEMLKTAAEEDARKLGTGEGGA